MQWSCQSELDCSPASIGTNPQPNLIERTAIIFTNGAFFEVDRKSPRSGICGEGEPTHVAMCPDYISRESQNVLVPTFTFQSRCRNIYHIELTCVLYLAFRVGGRNYAANTCPTVLPYIGHILFEACTNVRFLYTFLKVVVYNVSVKYRTYNPGGSHPRTFRRPIRPRALDFSTYTLSHCHAIDKCI